MNCTKENAYIRVANAAYRIAVKHTQLELIEHDQWRELENSLSELIQIGKDERERSKEPPRAGFRPR